MHDHASTHITMPPEVRGKAVLFAGKIPSDELAADGLEYDTHITVKYGLDDSALEQAETIIRQYPSFPIRLGSLSVFKNPGVDVLKIGVTSPGLERLHSLLGELPNREEKRPYSPHITLAYLKGGTGDKYVGLEGPLYGEQMWVQAVTLSHRSGERRKIPLAGREVHKAAGPFQTGNEEIDDFLYRYQIQIMELVSLAQRRKITREQFYERLAAITESSIAVAFLIPGGDGELPGFSETIAAITRYINQGAENFTGDVFNGVYEGDGDGVMLRVGLWAATVAGAYTLGQVFNRERNRRYVWKLGATSRHCSDCAGFHGQEKTAAEWQQGGLWPQSRALECRGYQCDCSLQPVVEKESVSPEISGSGSFLVFKDAKGQDRWVAISSNAYEDRSGEVVTLKALQEDVDRADADGDYGPLRIWHMKGLDIGDCDFNVVVGRSLIESGLYRHPMYARACEKAASRLQLSLGFFPSPGEPDEDRLYHRIWRRERSILPIGKADNPLTKFMTTQKAR